MAFFTSSERRFRSLLYNSSSILYSSVRSPFGASKGSGGGGSGKRGASRWHQGRPSFSILSETPPQIYRERQQRLLSMLPPHSILILPAADQYLAAGDDIFFPHQQDSLFYHLFGYTEAMRRPLAPFMASEGSEKDMEMTFACFIRPSVSVKPPIIKNHARSANTTNANDLLSDSVHWHHEVRAWAKEERAVESPAGRFMDSPNVRDLPFINATSTVNTLLSSSSSSSLSPYGSVLLFVPSRTTDPNVAVWGVHSDSPNDIAVKHLQVTAGEVADPSRSQQPCYSSICRRRKNGIWDVKNEHAHVDQLYYGSTMGQTRGKAVHEHHQTSEEDGFESGAIDLFQNAAFSHQLPTVAIPVMVSYLRAMVDLKLRSTSIQIAGLPLDKEASRTSSSYFPSSSSSLPELPYTSPSVSLRARLKSQQLLPRLFCYMPSQIRCGGGSPALFRVRVPPTTTVRGDGEEDKNLRNFSSRRRGSLSSLAFHHPLQYLLEALMAIECQHEAVLSHSADNASSSSSSSSSASVINAETKQQAAEQQPHSTAFRGSSSSSSFYSTQPSSPPPRVLLTSTYGCSGRSPGHRSSSIAPLLLSSSHGVRGEECALRKAALQQKHPNLRFKPASYQPISPSSTSSSPARPRLSSRKSVSPGGQAALDEIKTPASATLPPLMLEDARTVMSRFRCIKSPYQVRQHLRSAAATAYVFQCLLRRAPLVTDEHTLQCEVERAIVQLKEVLGPRFHVMSSYRPVIASGRRALYIHYTDNNYVNTLPLCNRHRPYEGEQESRSGHNKPNRTTTNLLSNHHHTEYNGSEWRPTSQSEALSELSVRVDLGVSVEYVPTDCTRTFPLGVEGFSFHQTPVFCAAYTTLLKIQRKLLQALHPLVTIAEIDKLHMDCTREGIRDLFDKIEDTSNVAQSEGAEEQWRATTPSDTSTSTRPAGCLAVLGTSHEKSIRISDVLHEYGGGSRHPTTDKNDGSSDNMNNIKHGINHKSGDELLIHLEKGDRDNGNKVSNGSGPFSNVNSERHGKMSYVPTLMEVRRVFCAHRFGHPFGLDIHEEHPPYPLYRSGEHSSHGEGSLSATAARAKEALLKTPIIDPTPYTVVYNGKYHRHVQERQGHVIGQEDLHNSDGGDIGSPLSRGGPKVLMPGMMYTVEPGLYFPDKEQSRIVMMQNDESARSPMAAMRSSTLELEDESSSINGGGVGSPTHPHLNLDFRSRQEAPSCRVNRNDNHDNAACGVPQRRNADATHQLDPLLPRIPALLQGLGLQIEDDVLILPPPSLAPSSSPLDDSVSCRSSSTGGARGVRGVKPGGADGGEDWHKPLAEWNACPWSRRDYLLSALLALTEQEAILEASSTVPHWLSTIPQSSSTSSSTSSLPLALGSVNASQIACTHLMTKLVYLQRLAVEGPEKAERDSEEDMRRIYRLFSPVIVPANNNTVSGNDKNCEQPAHHCNGHFNKDLVKMKSASAPVGVGNARALPPVSQNSTSPADELSVLPECTSWYPYDILVLTACVPKDRSIMNEMMQRTG